MAPRYDRDVDPEGLAEPERSFTISDPPTPPGLLSRLRNYFLTGVIITAPFAITIFLVWQFISFLDSYVARLVPAYYIEQYLPFGIPGGLAAIIACFTKGDNQDLIKADSDQGSAALSGVRPMSRSQVRSDHAA